MRRCLLLCALALSALGCDDSVVAPALRDDEPTIAGTIVDLNAHTTIAPERLTIHVRESLKDECGIVFTVFPGTDIRRQREDGSLAPAGPDDLKIGVKVYVWSGVVLDSCPGQAGAEAIEIVPG